MVLTLESQGEGFVTWDTMGHSQSVSTEDVRKLLLTYRLWRRRGRSESVGCLWRRQDHLLPFAREHIRASAGGERESLGHPEVTLRTLAWASCRALVSGLCVALRCAQRAVCCVHQASSKTGLRPELSWESCGLCDNSNPRWAPSRLAQNGLKRGVDRSVLVLPLLTPQPPSCRWTAARPSCCYPGCCFCLEFPPSELPRNLSFHTLLTAWCGSGCVPPGTCEGDLAWKEGLFRCNPVKIVTRMRVGPQPWGW